MAEIIGKSMAFKNPYNKRILKVKELLNKKNLDVILFFSPENIRYLTGFTGDSGVLVCKSGSNFLFTDSRYREQAIGEVHGARIKKGDIGMLDICSFIGADGIKHAGVESDAITLSLSLILKRRARGVRFKPLITELLSLRAVKDSEELASIKRAINISENSLLNVMHLFKEGVTEREVATELECEMKKRGDNALSFEVIVLFGNRTSMPHGKPGKRKLKAGDLIIVDFGARFNGYCSDETLTFVFKKVAPKQKFVYTAVNDARLYAIEKIKAGVKASEVDALTRGFLKKKGLAKYFGHGLGHGIGLAVHEPPVISIRSDVVLEEGMVFTIEPGVYIPGWGGVRLEDMVVVEKHGAKVLTNLSKELEILR
ncbi:MAG TPA: Xaa-Pro peptidase family protein [bacterium]